VVHDLFLVLINSIVWIIWSVVVGYSINKFSKEQLEKAPILPVNSRTSSRIQYLTRIKTWKDQVPEAGSMFKGGTSKRNLLSMSTESLQILRTETLRAELAHYIFPVILPIFFIFNPLYLSLAMGIYAFFANVPFILIQRYNRSRLDSILATKLAK